jgi:hypothetical protein
MGTESTASGVFIDPLQHVPTNERLREPFKADQRPLAELALPLLNRQPGTFTMEEGPTVAWERPAMDATLAYVLDTSNVA